MSLENQFKKFLYDFISYSNTTKLKAFVKEYADVNFTYCKISDTYNTVEFVYRNESNKEPVEEIFDVDQHLWKKAAVYIENPTILSSQIPSSSHIEMYLRALKIALNEIENDEFYKNFPAYRAAIIKLGNKLVKIKDLYDNTYKSSRLKVNKRNEKQVKVVELEWVKEIIENSEQHDEAVQNIKNKLGDEFRDFTWTERDGKIYTDSKGRIVKTSVAKIIEKIAKQKWGVNEAPKDKWIYKTLYPNRR